MCSCTKQEMQSTAINPLVKINEGLVQLADYCDRDRGDYKIKKVTDSNSAMPKPDPTFMSPPKNSIGKMKTLNCENLIADESYNRCLNCYMPQKTITQKNMSNFDIIKGSMLCYCAIDQVNQSITKEKRYNLNPLCKAKRKKVDSSQQKKTVIDRNSNNPNSSKPQFYSTQTISCPLKRSRSCPQLMSLNVTMSKETVNELSGIFLLKTKSYDTKQEVSYKRNNASYDIMKKLKLICFKPKYIIKKQNSMLGIQSRDISKEPSLKSDMYLADQWSTKESKLNAPCSSSICNLNSFTSSSKSKSTIKPLNNPQSIIKEFNEAKENELIVEDTNIYPSEMQQSFIKVPCVLKRVHSCPQITSKFATNNEESTNELSKEHDKSEETLIACKQCTEENSDLTVKMKSVLSRPKDIINQPNVLVNSKDGILKEEIKTTQKNIFKESSFESLKESITDQQNNFNRKGKKLKLKDFKTKEIFKRVGSMVNSLFSMVNKETINIPSKSSSETSVFLLTNQQYINENDHSNCKSKKVNFKSSKSKGIVKHLKAVVNSISKNNINVQATVEESSSKLSKSLPSNQKRDTKNSFCHLTEKLGWIPHSKRTVAADPRIKSIIITDNTEFVNEKVLKESTNKSLKTCSTNQQITEKYDLWNETPKKLICSVSETAVNLPGKLSSKSFSQNYVINECTTIFDEHSLGLSKMFIADRNKGKHIHNSCSIPEKIDSVHLKSKDTDEFYTDSSLVTNNRKIIKNVKQDKCLLKSTDQTIIKSSNDNDLNENLEIKHNETEKVLSEQKIPNKEIIKGSVDPNHHTHEICKTLITDKLNSKENYCNNFIPERLILMWSERVDKNPRKERNKALIGKSEDNKDPVLTKKEIIHDQMNNYKEPTFINQNINKNDYNNSKETIKINYNKSAETFSKQGILVDFNCGTTNKEIINEQIFPKQFCPKSSKTTIFNQKIEESELGKLMSEKLVFMWSEQVEKRFKRNSKFVLSDEVMTKQIHPCEESFLESPKEIITVQQKIKDCYQKNIRLLQNKSKEGIDAKSIGNPTLFTQNKDIVNEKLITSDKHSTKLTECLFNEYSNFTNNNCFNDLTESFDIKNMEYKEKMLVNSMHEATINSINSHIFPKNFSLEMPKKIISNQNNGGKQYLHNSLTGNLLLLWSERVEKDVKMQEDSQIVAHAENQSLSSSKTMDQKLKKNPHIELGIMRNGSGVVEDPKLILDSMFVTPNEEIISQKNFISEVYSPEYSNTLIPVTQNDDQEMFCKNKNKREKFKSLNCTSDGIIKEPDTFKSKKIIANEFVDISDKSLKINNNRNGDSYSALSDKLMPIWPAADRTFDKLRMSLTFDTKNKEIIIPEESSLMYRELKFIDQQMVEEIDISEKLMFSLPKPEIMVNSDILVNSMLRIQDCGIRNQKICNLKEFFLASMKLLKDDYQNVNEINSMNAKTNNTTLLTHQKLKEIQNNPKVYENSKFEVPKKEIASKKDNIVEESSLKFTKHITDHINAEENGCCKDLSKVKGSVSEEIIKTPQVLTNKPIMNKEIISNCTSNSLIIHDVNNKENKEKLELISITKEIIKDKDVRTAKNSPKNEQTTVSKPMNKYQHPGKENGHNVLPEKLLLMWPKPSGMITYPGTHDSMYKTKNYISNKITINEEATLKLSNSLTSYQNKKNKNDCPELVQHKSEAMLRKPDILLNTMSSISFPLRTKLNFFIPNRKGMNNEDEKHTLSSHFVIPEETKFETYQQDIKYNDKFNSSENLNLICLEKKEIKLNSTVVTQIKDVINDQVSIPKEHSIKSSTTLTEDNKNFIKSGFTNDLPKKLSLLKYIESNEESEEIQINSIVGTQTGKIVTEQTTVLQKSFLESSSNSDQQMTRKSHETIESLKHLWSNEIIEGQDSGEISVNSTVVNQIEEIVSDQTTFLESSGNLISDLQNTIDATHCHNTNDNLKFLWSEGMVESRESDEILVNSTVVTQIEEIINEQTPFTDDSSFTSSVISITDHLTTKENTISSDMCGNTRFLWSDEVDEEQRRQENFRSEINNLGDTNKRIIAPEESLYIQPKPLIDEQLNYKRNTCFIDTSEKLRLIYKAEGIVKQPAVLLNVGHTLLNEQSNDENSDKYSTRSKKKSKSGRRVRRMQMAFPILPESPVPFEFRIKKSVLILADGHGRDCAHRLKSNLGDSYYVLVLFKPNATLVNATENLVELTRNMKNNDVVVIMAGCNDVGADTESSVATKMLDIIKQLTNVKVIVSTIPFRHDIPSLNKAISSVNKSLFKAVRNTCAHVFEFNRGLSRQFYTRHGLHLTALGKDRTCARLADHIKNIEHFTYRKTYRRSK